MCVHEYSIGTYIRFRIRKHGHVKGDIEEGYLNGLRIVIDNDILKQQYLPLIKSAIARKLALRKKLYRFHTYQRIMAVQQHLNNQTKVIVRIPARHFAQRARRSRKAGRAPESTHNMMTRSRVRAAGCVYLFEQLP